MRICHSMLARRQWMMNQVSMKPLGKSRENAVEQNGSTRFGVQKCSLHFYRAVSNVPKGF